MQQMLSLLNIFITASNPLIAEHFHCCIKSSHCWTFSLLHKILLLLNIFIAASNLSIAELYLCCIKFFYCWTFSSLKEIFLLLNIFIGASIPFIAKHFHCCIKSFNCWAYSLLHQILLLLNFLIAEGNVFIAKHIESWIKLMLRRILLRDAVYILWYNDAWNIISRSAFCTYCSFIPATLASSHSISLLFGCCITSVHHYIPLRPLVLLSADLCDITQDRLLTSTDS